MDHPIGSSIGTRIVKVMALLISAASQAFKIKSDSVMTVLDKLRYRKRKMRLPVRREGGSAERDGELSESKQRSKLTLLVTLKTAVLTDHCK